MDSVNFDDALNEAVKPTANQLVIALHGDEGDDFVHEVVHEANHVTIRVMVHETAHVSVRYRVHSDHVLDDSTNLQLYQDDVRCARLMVQLVHLSMAKQDDEHYPAEYHVAKYHFEVEVNSQRFGHFYPVDILCNWQRCISLQRNSAATQEF